MDNFRSKFAEILLSDEITNGFKTIEWSIADNKEFNKMASAAQGRIVQNLAYCCHLNPPDVRVLLLLLLLMLLSCQLFLVVLGIYSYFRLAQR